MVRSTPVRLVGCNAPGPSDPVRIVNWEDVAQLDAFENTEGQFDLLTGNVMQGELVLSYTTQLVGGVRRVRVNWNAHKVNIGGVWHNLPAGGAWLNTADVVNPTTYYIYARLIGGVVTGVSTPTNPETDPAVNYEYAWISIARIKSNAGVAVFYFIRRAHTNIDLLLHKIGEWDIYQTPLWIAGGGITINAVSGAVDMAALDYRRLRFSDTIAAVTAGPLLLESEAVAYANLELVATYSDGSAVTAGKYHKLLLGVNAGLFPDYPFVIVRQGKPSVEYSSLAAATVDAERMAATDFPSAYRGDVFPLAYVIMKVGDASDLTTVDLRATGVTGSGGGGTPVADHSLLVNLGADDHLQYLRTDGTRTLTGNMAVGGGVTIDGVDISAHAANANAHHNAVTLNADADILLGLAAQQLTLDTQTANTFLCGPYAGPAAAPTFRALAADDIAGARAYATIYVANGVATQALTLNVPAKLNLFANNGVFLNATPDQANDQITVVYAGHYQISAQFSILSNINNIIFQFHAAVGGVNTYLGTHKKLLTGTDQICCSFIGNIALAALAVVTINVVADKSNNLTLIDGQLNVLRVG